MSNTDPVSPYPTQAEILREIAKALGVKGGNKKLDDYVRTGDVHYQLRDEIIHGVILEKIESAVTDDFASAIEKNINNLLETYLYIVIHVPLDGLPRNKSLPLLIQYYFSWAFANTLKNLVQLFDSAPSYVRFLDSKESAIDIVFQWMNKKDVSWKEQYTKEEKDKFLRWQKGENLPLITSIVNMKESRESKSLLLLARFIDAFRYAPFADIGTRYTREYLWSAYSSQQECGMYLSTYNIQYTTQKYGDFKEQASNILTLLKMPNKDKNKQLKIRKMIEHIKELQSQRDPDNLLIFWVSWCEAWFYTLSGELKKANKCYKQALKQSLYSAGRNQLMIMEQSLVVAAKASDRAFCKQLKNQGIVFKFFGRLFKKDSLDLATNNKKSRSRSRDVEDWEIDSWRYYFDQIFPGDTWFEEVTYDSEGGSGILYLTDRNYEPDYKNPNKKIKVGETLRKKTYPQLVWFTALDSYPNYNTLKIVEKLLEAGASVDLYSDSGETAILQALLNMGIFEYTDRPTDDSCFNIISSYPHKPETLNRRSVKKKLLPLTCAVDTGKPEVVKKLLDMGADVDRKGGIDMVSALYQTLLRIALIRNPERTEQRIRFLLNIPTPEALEAARRYSGDIGGFTLEHQLKNKSENPELFNKSFEAIMSLLMNKQHWVDVKKMYEIADILLEYEANPNEEVYGSIKGYTPLMFAAELDEADLFQKMLNHEGNPDKTHHDSHSGKPFNCRKIVERWKSTKVAEILDGM